MNCLSARPTYQPSTQASKTERGVVDALSLSAAGSSSSLTVRLLIDAVCGLLAGGGSGVLVAGVREATRRASDSLPSPSDNRSDSRTVPLPAQLPPLPYGRCASARASAEAFRCCRPLLLRPPDPSRGSCSRIRASVLGWFRLSLHVRATRSDQPQSTLLSATAIGCRAAADLRLFPGIQSSGGVESLCAPDSETTTEPRSNETMQQRLVARSARSTCRLR